MEEKDLPPAIDGVEQRLDAIIRQQSRIIELLSPPQPKPVEDSSDIELLEPDIRPHDYNSKKKSWRKNIWASDGV